MMAARNETDGKLRRGENLLPSMPTLSCYLGPGSALWLPGTWFQVTIKSRAGRVRVIRPGMPALPAQAEGVCRQSQIATRRRKGGWEACTGLRIAGGCTHISDEKSVDCLLSRLREAADSGNQRSEASRSASHTGIPARTVYLSLAPMQGGLTSETSLPQKSLPPFRGTILPAPMQGESAWSR